MYIQWQTQHIQQHLKRSPISVFAETTAMSRMLVHHIFIDMKSVGKEWSKKEWKDKFQEAEQLLKDKYDPKGKSKLLVSWPAEDSLLCDYAEEIIIVFPPVVLRNHIGDISADKTAKLIAQVFLKQN